MYKMSLEELLDQDIAKEALTDSEPEDNPTEGEDYGENNTEEGYGGNDTEEGGETTYENGEWSGTIVEPENLEAPVKEESSVEQEVKVTEVSEKTTAPEKVSVLSSQKEATYTEADEANEITEVTEKEVVKENDEQVAYVGMVQEKGGAVISGNEVDVQLLAHLAMALVVAVAIGAMLICNLWLKPKKMKIEKVVTVKAASKKTRKK